LNAVFVADGAAEALIALPAWLVAGAVAGWFGTRLRQADSAHAVDLRAVTERVAETGAEDLSLAEAPPAPDFVRPGKGRPLFFSSPIEGLVGYSGDECVHDPELFLRLVHLEDRDRVSAAINGAVETAEPQSCDYRLLARDGRVVWVHDEAVMVRDAHGQPPRI